MITSDFLTVLFTTFVACFGVIYLIKKYAEIRKLPPGPWGLPFVGYSVFITLKPHLKVTQLSKKYGSIFSVRLGNVNVVFLNDWKSVKDTLSKDEFNGRPLKLFGEGLFRNNRSILGESGSFWKEHRRFAFQIFRDLGFGKKTMEMNIKAEICHLMKEIDSKIEEKVDEPIKIHELLIPSVSNNICYFVFGHRYEYDDPLRKKMDFLLEQTSQLFQITNMIAFFELLISLAKIFGGSQLKIIFEKLNEFEKLLDDEIAKHEKTMDENQIRDYFDAFLMEMKRRKEMHGKSTFTRGVLNSNSRTFFGAGSETVRTTLDWLLKLIAEHQNIQKAVQKEVDDVVGSDRLPSWSDRELMPFTQAVILETLRWTSIVPLNIPRRAMQDSTISGHFIPKDTVVIANFWAINRDPKLWTNPDDFNPHRFLTKDNQLLKVESFTPFSYGKRNCVGETLAKFELFLYLTILMQNYEITVPNGVKQSFDSWLGISLQPTQVPVLTFKKRKH